MAHPTAPLITRFGVMQQHEYELVLVKIEQNNQQLVEMSGKEVIQHLNKNAICEFLCFAR